MAARARPGPDVSLPDALQHLGAKRLEAILVAALLEAGSLGTQDAVERTGLRQPEVSVGMGLLRDRGWVEAERIPREGKGRPMHRYRLVVAPAALRRHYEAAGKAAITTYKEAVRVLKAHLD